jgi:hypothetical protein
MEKDIPSKWNLKANRSSYTHIWQAVFKPESVRGDKEDHFTLIKGTIQQGTGGPYL